MNVTVGELLGDFILIAGSFILLLVLVKKHAWSNFTSIFEQRAEKIAADIDGVEQARQKQKYWLRNAKMNWLVAVKKLRQSLRMRKKQLRKAKLVF